jgi:molybdopterin synthase catalytic subunit
MFQEAAFDACRFAIDTIKKIVPIWKKEFYQDGEVWIGGELRITNDE